MKKEVQVHSLFTDFDISLFKAGKHYRLYEKFGSHIIDVDGVERGLFCRLGTHGKGGFSNWRF